MGVGAAAYFALPTEPVPSLVPWLWVVSFVMAGAAIALRRHGALFYACVLVAVCAAGFALAQQRAISLAPPPMQIEDRARGVEGWIERVERSGPRERLVVRVSALQGVPTPPRRIQMLAQRGDFRPGDAIRARAVLSLPRGPSAPGGHDGARAAWFNQISLTGFAIAPLQELDGLEQDRLIRAFLGWRWGVAERIRSGPAERTGGILAALMTGDRLGIGADDSHHLQLSGLGHILAISGLHMALVAGGIYLVAWRILSAIDVYARARDPRKLAALIALAAATVYLLLSGMSVPTQRAFIMTVIVLVGVIIERRGFSMRSLAFAALIILVLTPESIVSIGFQMSFAAVAALIAAYDIWRREAPAPLTPPGWLRRVRNWAGGLFFTSLVAGAATGAFAIFHFQRMAVYGLWANMIAMPVFTMVVMPFSVIGLGLMPFGLDGIAFYAADQGMRVVLAIARWTAELPGAGAPALAAPGGVVAVWALGFVLLVVGMGLTRVVGAVVLASSYLIWAAQTAPDMMVSQGGVVVARFVDPDGQGAQDPAWTVTDRRRSRFDTTVFMQRAGQGRATPDRAALDCDALGCVGLTIEGLRVAVTDHPQALEDDCDRVDLIVLRGPAASIWTENCAAMVLDETARGGTGGAELWVREDRITRLNGANIARGDRLWTRR